MMRFGPGYGYNQMNGGVLFGGILMLMFWVLLIVGIVVLVRWASHASHQQGMGHGQMPGTPGAPGAHMVPPATGVAGHDEAVAIAKRRLAMGEITSAEYEEIMRVLSA